VQYLMLVRVDPDLAARGVEPVEPWVEEGARTGVRLHGRPLEDPDTATTVGRQDGRTVLADGPFAETKEIVAGYDLLEAPDLDTVIDYAGRHPVAAAGSLEIREVWDDFVEDREGDLPGTRTDGTDYLFLHVPDPALLATVSWPEVVPDLPTWVRDVEDRGATLGGWRLRDADAANAATVRVRDGETLVARGPFTETAEQIAGVDLVRVEDLDEAIALAGTHPTSAVGRIEVRPMVSA
jgi:hypothetical protein